jgi:predicted amidophosphoribosyltransferase
VKKIPLKVLNIFQELHELFGTPHCPKCKGLQERYELCPSCCQTLGFKPECFHIQPGKRPVWQLFTWNRRIQRIWYGVKFHKRYGPLFLIERAFQQALAMMPPFEEGRPVWVLHPPFQPNKPNVFASFLEPICQKQGWRYMPNAFAFQLLSEQSANETKALHHTQSRLERKRLLQNRFKLDPSFVEALSHQPIQPTLIVVDDFMTTGLTLTTCFTLLQNALTQHKKGQPPPNHAICDKIESAQAQLQAIVITAVPNTSAV